MMSITPKLVDALETEFKVPLSADETTSVRSALDLYRLVLRKLGLVPGQTIGISACVFRQLCGAIVRRYGLEVRQLRPRTFLRDVLPARRWDERLIEVANDVGLSPFIPEIPPKAKNRADWTAASCMAAVGLPLLFMACISNIDAGNRIPEGLVILPPLALVVAVGVWVHGRLLRGIRLRSAGLEPAKATLRALTAACVGPLGGRLGLYDHRIAGLWWRTMGITAEQLGVDISILTANPALTLGDHWRGELPDRDAQTVAAIALQSPLAVQRECLAELLAAFMRGEVTSFAVWQVLFLLQGGQHEELRPLAAAMAHVVDSRNDYPIIVFEEGWEYVRRMIAALRSDLPLQGYSFRGSDVRHRPPEVALEPFWTAQQWLRCEPLLADLDLPQFDPQVHSSPAAAVALRPRVEVMPRGVYRTVMVSRDRAMEGKAAPT